MSNHEPLAEVYPEATLYLSTADLYLNALAHGDYEDDEARREWVDRTDLDHEIAAQSELVGDLIDEYKIQLSRRLDTRGIEAAIEDAKLDLGYMLVDKGNLPQQ